MEGGGRRRCMMKVVVHAVLKKMKFKLRWLLLEREIFFLLLWLCTLIIFIYLGCIWYPH